MKCVSNYQFKCGIQLYEVEKNVFDFGKTAHVIFFNKLFSPIELVVGIPNSKITEKMLGK